MFDKIAWIGAIFVGAIVLNWVLDQYLPDDLP
jgi:hypothetical protein